VPGLRNLAHQTRQRAEPERERRAMLMTPSERRALACPPPIVTLWRGTALIDIETAAGGQSWTDDRDTACRFAIVHAEVGQRCAIGDAPSIEAMSPLVVRAEVPRERIAAVLDIYGALREFVLLDPPEHYAIDGDPEDWQEGCCRFNQRFGFEGGAANG
jgi:hypothetical protein